jgi:hypothetical protein
MAEKKIGGSAKFEPRSNLNLAVLQVRFAVLPLLSLTFGSGSKFGQIP